MWLAQQAHTIIQNQRTPEALVALQTLRSLGVLTLEVGLPAGATPPTPRPGSLLNPTTFDFPIITETVAEAWPDTVVRGDPSLEPAYIAAARSLVKRGAVAISSNCGFSIRHQGAVAASVNVPVVMSSLLLAPALLRQLSPAAKLAVVTADSTHCGEDLLGISDQGERKRVVIGGIEGGKLLQNEMKRPPSPTDVADIQADVAACVARLRAAHPEIEALLFECTAFPLVTSAIRHMTRLPIYDIVTLCRMTMASIP
ncbi:hypothetical protein [Bradyrhizobium brasilense]|uniref:Aspartate/glutamate racemase family protein n=1 Tax=Bradyrhizobium brasilense TaxID=1419277 RepID=A0ABY8JF84_9BRAD|nr:hypothetical protein [Bradyrhizobium brasilense]WFU62658.1 hypothetical protein QA636_35290 [Bradyrhizobium brasilense]